ncbi:Phosphatidylinositol transfer protein [Tritrichomonas foetus]|uniref:Phosphatidylinositol transfer protein n=1 Tax=Tritrichomonas foetus TaxID=1144522 RepID=A0A1J4JX98_9EUKA|nr:Phosphatidylinositol transfer protein [Tritrichomonas foetus]|eukprot:OHT03088.1 Phosphatidylinositol transfer protein [Tritrichomonas foetus]
MKIVEFRIILPTNVPQYQIGNLYMCAQRTREEAGNGEGIEILKNEPYENWNGENGQFTHKIMHFKSRVPAAIRWAIPDKYLHVHEVSHNGYPHFHTLYNIPGQDDWFSLLVESQHIEYESEKGIPENVLNLTEEELKIRKVIYLDIINSNPAPSKKEWDMHDFICPEAGVETKLFSPTGKCDETQAPDWTNEYKGTMMACVKVIKFNFKWRGLQDIVENFALNNVLHDTFLDSNRALMHWADKWFPMDMQQIRELEDKVLEEQKSQEFIRDE